MLETVLTNPIFAFIVLVGLVVFFHEWGHFIVGRLLGVAVEEFSIGFGPRAYGFHRNGTEYKICWLPLGGYVRFYGAEIGGDIPPERREESILTAALYKRALISIAGPAANFLLSLLIMFVLSGTGIPMPSARVAVMAAKPAALAGLSSGDRVVAIGGEPVRSWKDLSERVAASPDEPLTLTVERPGLKKTFDVVVTPEAEQSESAFGESIRVGRIGVTQFFPAPRLVRMEGGLEDAFGVQTEDTVSAIAGKSVTYVHELFGALDAAAGVSGPHAFAAFVVDSEQRGTLGALVATLRLDVTREGAPLSLSADAAKLAGWARRYLDLAAASERPVTAMHWDEVFLTTDLLVQDPASQAPLGAEEGSELQVPSKNAAGEQAAQAAWQSCGVGPGVAFRGVAAGAGSTLNLASPVDLSLVLRDAAGGIDTPPPPSLAKPGPDAAGDPRAVGRSDSFAGTKRLEFVLVDREGHLVKTPCDMPVRLKRDQLNRERPEVVFPFRFVTSGLPVEQVVVRSDSWWNAPGDAVAAVGEQASTIFVGLKKLVSGSIPLANLGGPIQIARVAGSAAEGGFLVFFLTVSWMSINIGMFNLLPLPALDGGALLMQGVEAAYGRPLPPAVQHLVQRLGVVLILALIVLVFYNDILRLLGG